jgi:type II secretion system protein I
MIACARRQLRGGGKPSGFTLVEVLVTMALMTIILPVVMRGISISMAAASNARHTAEAATLAESKLNELLVSADPTSFGSQGDFGTDWPDYRWTMQSNYDSEIFLTQYTITVIWKERGRERTFRLSTFLADPAQSSSTTS